VSGSRIFVLDDSLTKLVLSPSVIKLEKGFSHEKLNTMYVFAHPGYNFDHYLSTTFSHYEILRDLTFGTLFEPAINQWIYSFLTSLVRSPMFCKVVHESLDACSNFYSPLLVQDWVCVEAQAVLVHRVFLAEVVSILSVMQMARNCNHYAQYCLIRDRSCMLVWRPMTLRIFRNPEHPVRIFLG